MRILRTVCEIIYRKYGINTESTNGNSPGGAVSLLCKMRRLYLISCGDRIS